MQRLTPARLHQLADQIARGDIDKLIARLRDQTDTGLRATSYDRTGSASGHSDPTSATAFRRRNNQDLVALQKALTAISTATAEVDAIARRNSPSAASRPLASHGPCRHGVTHHPRSDGKVCAEPSCGKVWPCNPEHPESWFDECSGTIDADGKCKICTKPGVEFTCWRCGEQLLRMSSTRGLKNGPAICGPCRLDVDRPGGFG